MKYDSRYRQAETLTVPSHGYGVLGEVDLTDDGQTPKTYGNPTSYRLTTLPLPEAPDTQYRAKVTDNLPLIAHKRFEDSQKWWIIADANPHLRHPLDLKTADILFLP